MKNFAEFMNGVPRECRVPYVVTSLHTHQGRPCDVCGHPLCVGQRYTLPKGPGGASVRHEWCAHGAWVREWQKGRPSAWTRILSDDHLP